MEPKTSKVISTTILVIMMLLGTILTVNVAAGPITQSGDYSYTLSGGSATIVGYTGAGGVITIPAILDGHAVVAIGDYSFIENNNVTSVTIPDSVKLLGNLSFAYCNVLSTITLGNGVTYIGHEAFFSCEALTSISIPNSVTYIGSAAFDFDYSLTAINVGMGNVFYNSDNGVLYNKGISELIRYPCGKVGSFSVPISVTKIDADAFRYCQQLTSVTIPNGVTSIGSRAFNSCHDLTTIDVAAGNPDFASANGVLYNKAVTTLIQCPNGMAGSFTIPNTVTVVGAISFGNCDKITSVTIPNSVVTIGAYAFAYCPSMTSVIIGSGVTTIEQGAFSICSGLTSVTIPASVTMIGNYAFERCTSIIAYNVAAGNPNYASLNGVLYDKDIKELIQYPVGKAGEFQVPDSVTEVGYGSFAYTEGLTSVTITNNVTYIDGFAFYHCLNLTSASVGNGVATIQNYAFSGCAKLTSVNLGDHIQILGNCAFSECTSLTSIKIPESVITIGSGTFSFISGLTSITIPKGVTTIDAYAFMNCSNLTSITFLGLGCPTTVGADWVKNTPTDIRGHAYSASNFPAPGMSFHGLVMGDELPIVPEAPESFTATAGNVQVQLQWTIPTVDGGNAITGYKVYRASTISGTYALISSQSGLNFTDANVINGQTYWYKVSAVNTNGEGAATGAISVIPAKVPSAPQNLEGTYDSSLISLSWQNPANDGGRVVTEYKVYRAASANGTYELITTTDNLTYKDASVESGQTYWYKVSAVNPMGEGIVSGSISVEARSTSSNDGIILIIGAIALVGVAIVIIFLLLRRKK